MSKRHLLKAFDENQEKHQPIGKRIKHCKTLSAKPFVKMEKVLVWSGKNLYVYKIKRPYYK
jgi:hypothetical protein